MRRELCYSIVCWTELSHSYMQIGTLASLLVALPQTASLLLLGAPVDCVMLL
jgi:hypothetical protein